MIALKNIKANRKKITCEAYVEDCRTPILLSFDRAKIKWTLSNSQTATHGVHHISITPKSTSAQQKSPNCHRSGQLCGIKAISMTQILLENF